MCVLSYSRDRITQTLILRRTAINPASLDRCDYQSCSKGTFRKADVITEIWCGRNFRLWPVGGRSRGSCIVGSPRKFDERSYQTDSKETVFQWEECFRYLFRIPCSPVETVSDRSDRSRSDRGPPEGVKTVSLSQADVAKVFRRQVQTCPSIREELRAVSLISVITIKWICSRFPVVSFTTCLAGR